MQDETDLYNSISSMNKILLFIMCIESSQNHIKHTDTAAKNHFSKYVANGKTQKKKKLGNQLSKSAKSSIFV